MHTVNMDTLKNSQDAQTQQILKKIVVNGAMDPGASRPWLDSEGRSWITVYDTLKKGDPTKPDSYKNIPLNTNATLMKDEWEQLETRVMDVAREQLVGVNDLVQNNMTYNLANPMATPVLTHQKGDVDLEASMTMDAITRTQGNRPDYEFESTPVPIIHVDYEINQRDLLVSRNNGNGIDTLNAEEATRTINEYLEDLLFTNEEYDYRGGKIQSYTNFTDRLIGSFTAWDASGKTQEDRLDDIQSMMEDSRNNYHNGPFIVYIPTGYEKYLDKDYNSTRGNTLYQRITQMNSIRDIKGVDHLTDGNIILLELRRENVHLVQGLGIQNMQWEEQGGMMNKFKVITIQFPRIRSDKNGRIGLVHYSTS